jgi:hypothetical protein
VAEASFPALVAVAALMVAAHHPCPLAEAVGPALAAASFHHHPSYQGVEGRAKVPLPSPYPLAAAAALGRPLAVAAAGLAAAAAAAPAAAAAALAVAAAPAAAAAAAASAAGLARQPQALPGVDLSWLVCCCCRCTRGGCLGFPAAVCGGVRRLLFGRPMQLPCLGRWSASP